MKNTLNFYALLLVFLIFAGCGLHTGNSNSKANDTGQRSAEKEVSANDDAENSSGKETSIEETNSAERRAKQPKNVREFFMALPQKFFVIEDCVREKEKNCEESKEKYLKRYLTVEDIKNGYIEVGGEGAQSAFKMAIFKRPDGTYLVGLNVFGEAEDSYKFLNYSNGKWGDVSIEVIPEYSSTNIYELPKSGTTIEVFAKKIIEQGEDFEVSEKGDKLYDLNWGNGEFSISK